MRGDFVPEEAEGPDTTGLNPNTKVRVSREQIAWLVVVFLLGVAAGALIVSLSGRSSSSPIIISSPVPPPTLEPTPLPAPIKVFVSGEVLNPAVYELPAGAI
ncbi:MAG: hypothetical protein WA996_00800, partial [Candidatus Promineifilaceae bacterium]